MATRWNSKHTGQKIDDTIDYVTNPNLLDNWYFGNPVNQRGVSSGTEWGGNTYGLDRWCAFSVGIYWDSNRYIVFPPRLENNLIYQRLKKSTFIVGSKITLSLLTDDGNLLFKTVTYTGNTIYGVLSGTIFGNTTIVVTDDYVEIRIWYTESNASEGHLAAAKLELGSQQTLAHQDANGNWVLNEIPDYGEQLARCQRYFQVFNARNFLHSHITVNKKAFVNVPTCTQFRVSPALTVKEAGALIPYDGSDIVFLSTSDYIGVESCDSGGAKIAINTITEKYGTASLADAVLWLSADL